MQSFSVQDRPANSKTMTSRWRCVIFSVSFGTTNARHFFSFFGTGWIATCCDVAGCTGCNDLVDFHLRSAAPKHLTRLKLALIDFGHGVVIHSLGIPGFLQPCAEPGSAVHLSSWRVLRTQIAKMQWFSVVDTARFVARMAK